MLSAQKHKQPTMVFLTRAEFDSLITVCDTNTFIGARDKLILYNSGIRVSELLAIKLTDIQKTDSINHANLKVYGKGRKQREIPLWKNTVKYINKYIKRLSYWWRRIFVHKSYYIKGSFWYLIHSDCGSFVVNGKAVMRKERYRHYKRKTRFRQVKHKSCFRFYESKEKVTVSTSESLVWQGVF